MTRDPWPDGPSGHVDLRLQPRLIRHATVRTGKPDVRSVQLGLEVGHLRVAVEVPDPAELVADLERAIEWAATGIEPE